MATKAKIQPELRTIQVALQVTLRIDVQSMSEQDILDELQVKSSNPGIKFYDMQPLNTDEQ